MATYCSCSPWEGFHGVLGVAGLPRKQLELNCCQLPDGVKGLQAAPSMLPELEHLDVWRVDDSNSHPMCFPTGVLQQLPQLTYLDLASHRTCKRNTGKTALQPLQALTQSADLRLRHLLLGCHIRADTLSGLCSLTCLLLAW
jgi:hypothetical protein